MTSLGDVLIAFAVVHSAFIALDVLTIRRDVRRGAAPALHGVGWPTVVFLAAVWVGYFAIQTALMACMPDVDALIAAAGIAPARVDAGLAEVTLVVIATYVVAGFWDYVFHRGLLHSRWGFFLHENHHLPTVVANGMPGISVRPFVAVTTVLTHVGTTATMLGALTAAGAAHLIGTYLASLPAMVLVLTAVGSGSHSAFLRKFSAVHAVLRPLFLTTPQEHLLHHGARLHGNYGNFTTLWDRVFGTYLRPPAAATAPIELGLAYDQDFLGTLTAGRWKIPPPMRARYRLAAFCHLSRRADAANEESAR